MKILENKYPLGSLPGLKTPGRYIDGILHENIKLLAKNVTKDMTYLGIISSSTLEVGTGKSVFAQQIAESYLASIKECHNIDIDLTMENIVFSPKEIIERSFKVPRYSVIISDEWEDAHYWSELGMSLRQFFRKCRQLNLFIILIIPNFFQLPMNYAISRSVFFIDVRFSGEFERGYFSFYNFQNKKDLFVQGRKTQNYKVVRPNFTGRFVDGYVVNEKEYRKEKMQDMLRQEQLEKKPLTEKQHRVKMFKQLHANLPKLSVLELAEGFGINKRTGFRWLNEEDIGVDNSDNATVTGNINTLRSEGDTTHHQVMEEGS